MLTLRRFRRRAATHARTDGEPLLRLSVLGIRMNVGSRWKFIEELARLSDRNGSAYVCFVNVHMVVEAKGNPAFLEVVNGDDINCPDGLPIAHSVGWFHGLRQAQIAGPDTLPQLMRIARHTGKRIFVLGGTWGVLAAFEKRALEDYGEGVVVGSYSPPFRNLTPEEDEELVQRINATHADMIFVALGCPKQERWMHAHRGRVNGCMFGLGYAIPVYSGMASRAPRWMIEKGLEWLFRLSTDPRRLFKRYLQTNSAFALYVLRAKLWRKIKLDPGETVMMTVRQRW